jgi:hypothetical protein
MKQSPSAKNNNVAKEINARRKKINIKRAITPESVEEAKNEEYEGEPLVEDLMGDSKLFREIGKKSKFSPKTIKFAIGRYYQIQKNRITMSFQIMSLKQQKEDTTALETIYDNFVSIEKAIGTLLAEIVKKHKMWEYLQGVKGIGPILAAGLLAHLDVHRADHVSGFWKICGLSVAEDGRALSRRKEHLIEMTYKDSAGKEQTRMGIAFDPFLKTLCYKIGESFVKSKGIYRALYDRTRKYYEMKYPTTQKINGKTFYSKAHKYAMAKRPVLQRFLLDMWLHWREMEGLKIDPPYAHKGETIEKFMGDYKKDMAQLQKEADLLVKKKKAKKESDKK